MLKDVINKIESDANNVNDTINTQQAEKQETVLVDNAVAENGGKQKAKGCFKKSNKPSEFKKMASSLAFSSIIGIAVNTSTIAYSIDGIKNNNDDLWYHFIATLSLEDFFKNACCLIYASIKLSKFKQNNKEVQTETAPKGKNLSRVLQNVIGRLDKVFNKSKNSREH